MCPCIGHMENPEIRNLWVWARMSIRGNGVFKTVSNLLDLPLPSLLPSVLVRLLSLCVEYGIGNERVVHGRSRWGERNSLQKNIKHYCFLKRWGICVFYSIS